MVPFASTRMRASSQRTARLRACGLHSRRIPCGYLSFATIKSMEFSMKRLSLLFLVPTLLLPVAPAVAQSSGPAFEIDRKGETIVLEPYGENIVRVTLSLNREPALRAPGYGIIGTPDAASWSKSETPQAETLSSPRLVVTLGKDQPSGHPPLQSQIDIGKFFNGSAPGAHITSRRPKAKCFSI